MLAAFCIMPDGYETSGVLTGFISTPFESLTSKERFMGAFRSVLRRARSRRTAVAVHSDRRAAASAIEPLEDRRLMAAGPVLYSHDSRGVLFTVDVSSGQTQSIGNMGVQMYDIAFDKSGQLYGVDRRSDLYKINRSTAAITRVGNVGSVVNSLVFSPQGKLLAAGGNTFVQIDPSTGKGTKIGDLDGKASAGDLAFDSQGRLFLSTTADRLVRVDPSTGNLTDVGAIGFHSVFGLAFGPDGVMYGLSDATEDAFKINLSTGAGTKLSNFGANVTGAFGSSFFGEAARPEIEMRGNSVVVNDNDTTPTTSDHTDFGSTAVSGGTVTRTYTVRNTGNGALNLSGSPSVKVSGANAGDFTVVSQPPSTLAAGASATFQVKFDPSASGLRKATLTLANNDADENPYNFDIQGNGSGATSGATVGVLAVDPNASEQAFGPASSGAFVVTRTKSSALTLTLSIGGSATLGKDYNLKVSGASSFTIDTTGKTLTLKLAAGSDPVSILVDTINDSSTESTESVVLTLKTGSGYSVNSSRASGTVSIKDKVFA